MLSNTLLSHLSALGAHRHRLTDDEDDAALMPQARRISELLEAMTRELHARQPVTALDEQTEMLLAALGDTPKDAATPVSSERATAVTLYRPIQSQLRLIAEQLTPLAQSADRLTQTRSEAP